MCPGKQCHRNAALFTVPSELLDEQGFIYVCKTNLCLPQPWPTKYHLNNGEDFK